MDEPSRLHPEDIEAIALRVAALMHKAEAPLYLTAEEVAKRYGVKEGWVYEHKRELGAVAMGTGKRPRLRFPVKACDDYMAARNGSDVRQQKRPKRRAKGHTASGLPLVPIPERLIPR